MIIGITGIKQSGKDVCAKYLVAKYNYIHLSFANPLKEICKTLFGFNEEQVNGNQKEEIDPFWNISPRKIMQFFGTEIFRDKIQDLIPNIENNFWIKLMEQRILKLNSPNIVISDVRFLNEVDFIKKYNGIIIKVNRNTEIDNHISEKEMNQIIPDYVIDNIETFDELYKKIDNIMKN